MKQNQKIEGEMKREKERERPRKRGEAYLQNRYGVFKDKPEPVTQPSLQQQLGPERKWATVPTNPSQMQSPSTYGPGKLTKKNRTYLNGPDLGRHHVAVPRGPLGQTPFHQLRVVDIQTTVVPTAFNRRNQPTIVPTASSSIIQPPPSPISHQTRPPHPGTKPPTPISRSHHQAPLPPRPPTLPPTFEP